MLKIKDNVDLKKLAKNDNFSIVWRDDSKYYSKGKIYFLSSPTNEELNILYDLIKTDLVEKVEEE